MTGLLRLLVLVMLLSAAALMSWSYPSLYGDTGLVVMPTADIIPNTYYDLSVNYARFPDNVGGSTTYPVRLTYGASDNAELAFMLGNSTHPGSPQVMGGTFKLSITKEDPYLNQPGLALGARIYRIRDLPGNTDRSVVDGYGVISKRLFGHTDSITEQGFVLRGHVAVTATAFSGDQTGTFISGAIGFSYQNANGSNIVADYSPLLKKDGLTFRASSVNAAIRYPLSDHFMFELGEAQLYGLGDQGTLYAGILYRYGMRSSSGEYQKY